MFRGSAKTAVLLGGLGGVMVAIGSLFGRGGAVIGLVGGPADADSFTVDPLAGRHVSLQNLFRTHPSAEQRAAGSCGVDV